MLNRLRLTQYSNNIKAIIYDNLPPSLRTLPHFNNYLIQKGIQFKENDNTYCINQMGDGSLGSIKVSYGIAKII